jgi:hypothetical protein
MSERIWNRRRFNQLRVTAFWQKNGEDVLDIFLRSKWMAIAFEIRSAGEFPSRRPQSLQVNVIPKLEKSP